MLVIGISGFFDPVWTWNKIKHEFEKKEEGEVLCNLDAAHLNACKQRYLMVNLDQQAMNKITLTSKKKSKKAKQERPLGCKKKGENVKKLLKYTQIVPSCP